MKNTSFFIVIGLVLLTGSLTYAVFNRLNKLGTTDSKLKFGIKPADLPDAEVTPTPKKTGTEMNLWEITSKPDTEISVTPTPSISEKTADSTLNETDKIADATLAKRQATSTTSTSRVCTPVYGMADTCVEHITVDTGAETEVLFNLAGLSYLGGLVAFVKAKTAKK